MINNHKMTTDDVCSYCSPTLDVIDEDFDIEDENTERDSKREEGSDTDSDPLDDLDEESTDSQDKQDEEDVEIDYSDDGEETSIWKKFKKKALKDNSDDKNIVKDVVQIYLVHVEFKLLMDKDKLHQKLQKEIKRKVKETHDEKSAFDFVWSRYKPAIEKAVFDLEVKLSAEEKKKRYIGTIFELEDEEDDSPSQLWHESLLPEVTKEDADEIYADPEKRKEVMKGVKVRYRKTLTKINEVERDWIHRLITKSAKTMLRNDEDTDIDETAAYSAAALERMTPML